MPRVKKGELLYEGKAKRLYATAKHEELLMEFKDSLTAFDAVKKGTLTGKGAINNQISAYIMGELNAAGIETCFIRQLTEAPAGAAPRQVETTDPVTRPPEFLLRAPAAPAK